MIGNKEIILIEKYLEGILSDEEKLLFDELITKNQDFRAEIEEQKKIRALLKKMNLKNPEKEVWDQYWAKNFNNAERSFSWIMILTGSSLLLTYAFLVIIESLIMDEKLPEFVRYSLVIIISGVLLLSFSIIREKITINKKDKFKEIER